MIKATKKLIHMTVFPSILPSGEFSIAYIYIYANDHNQNSNSTLIINHKESAFHKLKRQKLTGVGT